LRAQDPLCTIKARAAKTSRARALLDRRTNWILGRLDHVQNERTPMGKETAH